MGDAWSTLGDADDDGETALADALSKYGPIRLAEVLRRVQGFGYSDPGELET
jgi:hypothetical protein